MENKIIGLCAVSLACGYCGALLISKFGAIDLPNERSSHSIPTRKGGGMGIVAAFIFASIVLNVSWGIWVPASLLAVISFTGDFIDISPQARLLIQFSAALATVYCWLDVSSLPLIALFAVFVVGTANFYNFMDGINGIAGMTGFVAFGSLALFAYTIVPDRPVAMLSLCLACACLGFLPLNMPSARIFMGDAGSIFLGFVYTALSLSIAGSWADRLCLAGFLFPFYADELSTMIIRIRAGQSLLKPHRRHLYQIMVNQCGYAHWLVSLAYAVAQLVIIGIIVEMRSEGVPTLLCFFSTVFICFHIANMFIHGLRENINHEKTNCV
jgi:Fuc2NAc and GlcNAc transferase